MDKLTVDQIKGLAVKLLGHVRSEKCDRGLAHERQARTMTIDSPNILPLLPEILGIYAIYIEDTGMIDYDFFCA